MMRSHNKVYAAGDAPLLLDVVQQPGVTCEAVAAAAARNENDAVDAYGATALHLICANERATPALLRAVAAALPEASVRATTTASHPKLGGKYNGAGSTAFTALVRNRTATPALLRALHAVDDGLISLRTDNGTTVYHDLALTPRPDDAERAALFECIHELAPDLVRVTHNWDYTPLHQICWCCGLFDGTRPETIEALYALDPAALRRKDCDGRTPLQSIYEKRAPLRCLRAVAALEPGLAADHGLTALHVACAARDATAADVEAAMDACAATLDAVDYAGLTALARLPGSGASRLRDERAADGRDHELLAAAVVARAPAVALRAFGDASLLQVACRCPEAARKAVAAVVRSRARGDTDTTQAVDEALLPEILHGLQGVALDHACAVDLLRDVVDSVNARPGAVVVIVSDQLCNAALCVFYAVAAYDLRAPAPARRRLAVSSAVVAVVASYQALREVLAFAAMRRLGAQRRYADDGFAYVKWLCFAWVGATFVVERRSRQLDVVAAWGALLLATRLLVDLRQLSTHLTRFIVALRMTLFDSAAFLLVLLIALVGFGEALYFLMAPGGAPMGFAYDAGSAGDDGAPDDPYASPQGMMMKMYAILLGEFDEAQYVNDWAFVMFVVFTLVGVIILLNLLIAVVSDSYENAQARSRVLFVRSRLELAAGLVAVFPRRFLRDAGLGQARGDMLRLLWGPKFTTRLGGAEERVGGVRAFLGEKHGYGAGGWALLACSCTVFLPAVAPWALARCCAGVCGGDASWTNPERLLATPDPSRDADEWLGRLGEIERALRRRGEAVDAALEAQSAGLRGRLEEKLEALESKLYKLDATNHALESKLDAVLARLADQGKRPREGDHG